MIVVNPPPLRVPDKLRESGKGFWDALISTIRLLWVNDRLRGTPRQNTVIVESSSDLPTPSGGIIQLEDNTYYEISGTFVTANSLKFGTNSFVAGKHWAADILYYTGTGAALIADNKAFNLKFLTVVAPNGSALDLTGSITTEFLASLCAFFNCASLGTVSGYRVPTFKSIAFDTYATGLTLTGTSEKVLFDGCPFRNNTGSGASVIFDSAFTTAILDMTGNYFKEAPPGGKGFEVVSGATFSNTAIVRGNAWDGVDNPVVGVSQATVGWDFRANSGVSDSQVLGFLYKTGASVATTLTLNTWTKAAMTTTLSTASQRIDMPTDNRLRYLGVKDVAVSVNMSFSITAAANNQTFNVGFYVNGVLDPESLMAVILTGPSRSDAVAISAIEILSTNDYVELYLQNTTGSNNATIDSFQFTISG